jgi:FKBP-type peptidyl-prolyl cis-trans isomerase SlyD
VKIAPNTVVRLEFTLKGESGELLDASDGDPLTYTHGYGELVPGLEAQLDGHVAGDHLQAVVAPADGFGERDEERVVQLLPEDLPPDLDPKVGEELEAEDDDGNPLLMWIIDVGPEYITVDGNHPLAGQILHFDVSVLEVREATAEEISDASQDL